MILSTSGLKCFKCKEGTYRWPKLDDITCDMRINDKCVCDKCGCVVPQHMGTYDPKDHLDGRILVDEEIKVDMSKLSGNPEDVIAYAKELSILYDNSYIQIKFEKYEDENKIRGIRFETDVEQGKRKLKEKRNKDKEDAEFSKIKEKRRLRYEELKEKYKDISV